jgi:hypothetical protein
MGRGGEVRKVIRQVSTSVLTLHRYIVSQDKLTLKNMGECKRSKLLDVIDFHVRFI